MEKKLDLRIQKTHIALTDAFLSLLNQKRFDNITVAEICDSAMVRRATFYKHFGDKYEFFTYTIRKIKEDFRKKNCDNIQTQMPADPYVQILRNIMDFLDESGLRVRSVMESDAYPILMEILSEEIYRDVMECFREDERNGKVFPMSLELMAQAYTGTIFYVAKWWILHKDQMPKEEVVTQLTALMQKSYQFEFEK